MSNFAEILNDLMIEHDINDATHLARVLDLGDSTISRYRNGHRLPSLECIVKIADYFNCTIDYLLGLEKENYPQEFLPCPPFADRIKYFLDRSNYSTRYIYLSAGVTKARFYDWKNGVSIPTIENVIKLAQFFN